MACSKSGIGHQDNNISSIKSFQFKKEKEKKEEEKEKISEKQIKFSQTTKASICLLYTSDAADE